MTFVPVKTLDEALEIALPTTGPDASRSGADTEQPVAGSAMRSAG
jgi:hypothetical protein